MSWNHEFILMINCNLTLPPIVYNIYRHKILKKSHFKNTLTCIPFSVHL